MNFNLIDLIILVSLMQGILLGILLLSGRFFRSSNNKFLAFFILMLSIIGLDDWFSSRDYDEQYYFIDFFGDDIPWILLCYVALFVYFIRSLNHPLRNNRKLGWLLLPFAVFLLLNILIDLDVDFGWLELRWVDQYMYLIFEIEYYLAMFYTVILCLLSYRIIATSTVSYQKKKWIEQIWWTTTALVSIWISFVLLSVWRRQEFVYFYYFLLLGVSFFLYWLTYKGLFQFQLVEDQAAIKELLKQKRSSTVDTPLVKTLPDQAYTKQLLDLMEVEHLYRNPDLNRDIIANRLGISVGYLSQIINAQEQNFTVFINTYRVQAVQEMLRDENFNQYSLLAIGMEAGFKSKSAFYNTFKKMVGMTPNEYKKQHLKS
ncbi:MAG: AraC family transcriptional regulator [Bacteroidota bacterium]